MGEEEGDRYKNGGREAQGRVGCKAAASRAFRIVIRYETSKRREKDGGAGMERHVNETVARNSRKRAGGLPFPHLAPAAIG